MMSSSAMIKCRNFFRNVKKQRNCRVQIFQHFHIQKMRMIMNLMGKKEVMKMMEMMMRVLRIKKIK